jgi:hypothetical protein
VLWQVWSFGVQADCLSGLSVLLSVVFCRSGGVTCHLPRDGREKNGNGSWNVHVSHSTLSLSLAASCDALQCIQPRRVASRCITVSPPANEEHKCVCVGAN